MDVSAGASVRCARQCRNGSRLPRVTISGGVDYFATGGQQAAEEVLSYVATVGEKEEYVERAVTTTGPYLP
jgi:hypothetical protein